MLSENRIINPTRLFSTLLFEGAIFVAGTMTRRRFLIRRAELALFDLESDPAEKNNLIKRAAGKRVEIE